MSQKAQMSLLSHSYKALVSHLVSHLPDGDGAGDADGELIKLIRAY
jgi:hypothetical protein